MACYRERIQIKSIMEEVENYQMGASVILSLWSRACIKLLVSMYNNPGSIANQGSSKPLVSKVFTGAYHILLIWLTFSL